MKLNKIIYIVPLAVLFITAGSGCRKSQFNINQNVNNPTDSSVSYDVVLPAALHATGTIVANQWGTIQNWMGFWARSGTYAPNVIEETYQITTAFGNGVWNSCYDNNYDYNVVQQKAAKAGAGFYEGIARIMKAHNFQILVDVYGNVPYTEALKASGNPTPKYDDGLSIYKDLLRQIDLGMSLIKGAPVTATNANKNIWTNDIMFGTGAIADTAAQKLKWMKFGNTLKLRMLIHAYAVAAINKTTEIAIINAEGSGYLGALENARVQPGYKSDKPNPFYNNYYKNIAGTSTANNVYYAANKWGIEWYDGIHDPRLSRMYEAGANGYVGVAYGLPPITDNAKENLAGIGPGLYRRYDSSQCIFSSAESYLLQAEARYRGFITSGASAQSLMQQGMVESFTFTGVTNPATAYTTYITYNTTGIGLQNPDVIYTAPSIDPAGGIPGGGLYTILAQKWLALNGINTLEVWTDYRRVPYKEIAPARAGASTEHFVYGEPSAAIGPGPTISIAPQIQPGAKIPVRYLYPQAEYNYNSANVGAQGVISPSSKIFWDLN